MTLLEKIPFSRLFIPFVTGIFAASVLSFSFFYLYILVLLFVLMLVQHSLFIKDEKKAFRYRWLFGFFLNGALFLLALILVHNSNLRERSDHFSQLGNEPSSLAITLVDEVPVLRPKSIGAKVKVLALKKGEQWVRVTGKVMQYFAIDSTLPQIKYGDLILQKADFTQVSPPGNPYEFDYKKYLEHDGITHQQYLPLHSWHLLSRNNGSKIHLLASDLRNAFMSRLNSCGIEGASHALLSALILGMRDNLDADTVKNFSAAGAIHVLCVSGLHVGILFLFLNFAFSFLKKWSWGRLLKVLLVLAIIWAYAFITGLAPSVLRACTMFSVIAIAQSFKKNTCIYNTLFLSAFILIVTDPAIVYKAGFWLSYLAVAGIVYLYPIFYNWVTIKNTIVEKIWSLICISLAAQIATAPLAVYYFNQFPNYFLITNIIAVPLATIIVYATIATLILSFVPYLSALAGALLKFLLTALNETTSFISQLPFATSTYVINIYQMILLYIFIMFILIYFSKKKPVYLRTALVVLTLFFSFASARSIAINSQEKMVVYSTAKGLGIDFIHKNKALFIADSSLSQDQRMIDFSISNNRRVSGVTNMQYLSLESLYKSDSLYNLWTYVYKNNILFGGKKIRIILQRENLLATDKPPVYDVVIPSSFQFKKPDTLNKVLHTNVIVIPKAVDKYLGKRFENLKGKENTVFHFVKWNGAYIYSHE